MNQLKFSTELGGCLGLSCPDWDGVEADAQSVGYRAERCSEVMGCLVAAEAAAQEATDWVEGVDPNMQEGSCLAHLCPNFKGNLVEPDDLYRERVNRCVAVAGCIAEVLSDGGNE